MSTLSELDIEVAALERNVRADPFYMVTQRQAREVARLMSVVFSNRDERIHALRILLGHYMWEDWNVEVHSSKNLTGPAAHWLIDLLREQDDWCLSERGRRILNLAAERIKAVALP